MIRRGAVRGVSFDYGHVLGGLDVAELAARLAAPAAAPAIEAAFPAAHAAHDRSIAAGAGHEGGWRAYMGALVSAARPDLDTSQVARAVDALWAAQPTRNLWRHVSAEARALLASLTAARVPLVLTTNSEGRAAELMADVGLAPHFRAVLDSGRLGIAKPDPRIFQLAAAAAGVPIEALAHVGDSERADVEGALAAGAVAIRFDAFNPAAARLPTAAAARAATFAELRAILADALAVPL